MKKLAIVLLLFCSILYSNNKGIDSSFNGGSPKIVSGLNSPSYGANGMGLDDSDNIYLYSDNSHNSVAILKLLSDGSADTSYDSGDGILVDSSTSSLGETDLEALSDGSTLVANRKELCKYSSNGSKDIAFETNIDSGLTTKLGTTGTDIRGGSIAIDGNDIYYIVYNYTTTSSGKYYLAKLNSDGSLNSDFNSGNIVTINSNHLNHSFPEVVIDNSGNIIVVGLVDNNVVTYKYNNSGVLLKAYKSVLNTFANTPSTRISGIDIDSNNNIYIATESTTSSSGILAKIKSDLSGLDTTFSTSGYVYPTIPLRDVAIASDDKILVAGQDSSKVYVYKYKQDGTLDTTFNTDGSAYATVASADVAEIELDSSERVVVGGHSNETSFFAIRFSNTIEESSSSSNSTLLFVPNYADDTVSVVDLETESVSTTIDVGDGPVAALSNSDGSKVYVANHIGNSISVVDVTNLSVEDTISSISGNNHGETGQAGPLRMSLSPSGDKLYVIAGTEISVIDTSNNTESTSYSAGCLGDRPVGVVVNSDDTELHIACYEQTK